MNLVTCLLVIVVIIICYNNGGGERRQGSHGAQIDFALSWSATFIGVFIGLLILILVTPKLEPSLVARPTEMGNYNIASRDIITLYDADLTGDMCDNCPRVRRPPLDETNLTDQQHTAEVKVDNIVESR